MNIYSIEKFNEHYDDNRGGSFPTDEYFLHRSAADRVINERNSADYLEQLTAFVKKFVKRWNRYYQAKQEHDALVAAGLRHEPFMASSDWDLPTFRPLHGWRSDTKLWDYEIIEVSEER